MQQTLLEIEESLKSIGTIQSGTPAPGLSDRGWSASRETISAQIDNSTRERTDEDKTLKMPLKI
jgi:hypothetical protein